MPRFLVQNLTERPMNLGIEPWAELEILAPRATAEFEYAEPAEIEFALLGPGDVNVSIVSDAIRVRVNGTERSLR